MRLIAWLIALLAPAASHATDNVALQSTVFVEKTVPAADGRNRVVLETPTLVTPGDKLVFVLAYRNAGSAPARDFVVTNPMPSAVAYQSAVSDGATVSIDGGRSWGSLAQLRVRESDGRWRSARAEDVTHIRWAMRQPIPAGGQGRLSFRGIVR